LQSAAGAKSAGLARRLAALIYDLLLLLGVWFVATALVLPLNGGQAFRPMQTGYSLYLLGVSVLFFGWFWTHGGQTLGMRAWALRLRTMNGDPVSWKHAVLRLAAACLSAGLIGLGYLWITIDPEGLAWHDRLSRTRVVHEKGGSE
jgi:uncharacterized RDD family membrane protein YckC